MKWNHGKFLITAAIPAIVAALPGVTFAANCNSSGQPLGAATWDSSVIVPRTATIGDGTEIGPGVTIGQYARIGTCSTIGMDGAGGGVAKYTQLGNNVTMRNGSVIGYSSRLGDGSIIDGSNIGHNSTIDISADISGGSWVGAYTKLGTNATITGSSLGQYIRLGNFNTISNSTLGLKSKYGNNVTINGTSASPDRIGQYATVYDSVNIGFGVTIGQKAVICQSVGNNMTIRGRDHYGCN